MASSSDSQTKWSLESNMQRLPVTRKFSNEIPHSISQVMSSSEPTLVVLKTGDRASEHLTITPCGSKTVALFFITYFVHTSLKQPLSWSSSLMVRLLDDVDFRTVGRYLLHETSSRAQDPTGSMLTGIILQGYPKSILSKLHLQWWSDFERRLEAGEIEFQQFMMHDSFLLTLRPDSKIQERGIPRYSIKKADPTSLSSCFEAVMSIAKIPFVDSLIKETLPADKERQPINLDQNRLFEHLAEFRKTQTIARNEAQQLIRADQRPRTGDLSRTTALAVVRQSQSSYELSLHPSESTETPRWVRQMQDDRHRSHSIPHAAGTPTRDRHISMSNETFFSTKSHDSKDTFVTASDGVRSSGSISSPRPGLGNKSSRNTDPFQCARGPRTDGPFFTLLKSRGLWPPHPTREHNWSGRGQHVEFQRNERHIIKELLDTSSTLGCTSSAVVEIVKCKRIHLARKTIFCSKHFTKQQAIEEVAHLEKIQHSHIVRVIGTYTIANEISILLYPVAEYNLETFLQELRDHCVDAYEPGCLLAVKDFFGCLANAVDFIHSKRTKHMDIKPKNILVRKVHRKSDAHESPWKVYIADFGIARSYSSIAASETEGPTMFTRKYAAPEVVEQDRRGLQADIFSLGCVFTEIGATIAEIVPLENKLLSSPVENLDARLASNENGDSSYHANIRTVQEFVQRSDIGNILRYYLQFRLRYAHDVIAQMLEPHPTNRPTARVVAAYFRGGSACCWDPPDPLEDSVPGMDEEFGHHLKAYDMTWDWCGERKRPPSPGNLSGEKKSAYRMSHLSLHSTSNLNY